MTPTDLNPLLPSSWETVLTLAVAGLAAVLAAVLLVVVVVRLTSPGSRPEPPDTTPQDSAR